jgi:hypothetical protein
MKFTFAETSHSAGIRLTDTPATTTHELTFDIVAFTDADGALCSVELLDTRPFGDPFDREAAERAVAWVRERMSLDAAS